jgi:hypothetical protein
MKIFLLGNMKRTMLSMCCEAFVERDEEKGFYKCTQCLDICDTFVANLKEFQAAKETSKWLK